MVRGGLVKEFRANMRDILFSMDTPRDEVVIRLFIVGGLTRSEVLNLEINNIDFDYFRIKIIREGNGGAVPVPLDGLTMLAIRHYMDEVRPKNSDYNNLLLSFNGNPLDPKEIVRVIDRARRRVGLDFDSNTLRYMAMVSWFIAGTDLDIIFERAGLTVSHKAVARFMNHVQDFSH